MNRFIEILSLSDNEIDSYIEKRLLELNSTESYGKIPKSNDAEIYHNWLNDDTTYLPSSYRSKGFKIDVQFIKDFIFHSRDNFGEISINVIKENVDEDWLINYFDMYSYIYFGQEDYDLIKRKEIYGYGSLNSIGKTLNLSDLKDLNVARCIEKAAGLNAILNFLDIDSSLIIGKANDVGHAYCLVNTNSKSLVVDPNFFGETKDDKAIPYIFEVDTNSDSFFFDPSEFGDNKALKVTYTFPSQKKTKIKS